jgi:hypothetical protein
LLGRFQIRTTIATSKITAASVTIPIIAIPVLLRLPPAEVEPVEPPVEVDVSPLYVEEPYVPELYVEATIGLK